MSIEADLYRQGQSIYQIAPVVGLSPVGVWDRLRRQGIPMSNRRKKVNEAFLDTWTPESAYAVGLLCTDGTVSKNQIEFRSKDRELVERFRSLFDSQHKVSEYKLQTGPYKGRTYYRVSITSKRLAGTAIKLGIIPNKSLVLGTIGVPDKFLGPFLAGVVDGDGTVDTRKDCTVPLRVRIFTGSQAFRDFLFSRLVLQNITGLRSGWATPTGYIYSLEFNSHKAKQIANFIYGGHRFGLERKRAVARPYLSQGES